MHTPVQFGRAIALALIVYGASGCAPIVRHAVISNGTTDSNFPRIASAGTDAGNVYISWMEDDRLAFSKARMGQPMGHVGNPAPGIAAARSANAHDIGAYGGRVYLAVAGRGQTNDVHFLASHDSGQSFYPPLRLSNHDDDTVSVSLAASGNNVIVGWVHQNRATGSNDDGVYIATSGDGGLSFSPAQALAASIPIGAEVRTGMDGDNVYVLWCRAASNTNPAADLYLAVSRDGGASFAGPFVLTDNVLYCPGIDFLVLSDRLYVAWHGQNSAGQPAVFVKSSNDAAASFFNEVNVSQVSARATNPGLSAAGNNVYVAWEQELASPAGGTTTDILFARSTDGGQVFGPAINLSMGNNDRASELPAVSANGAHVHVLWQDAAGGTFDIFYRKSTDGGITFQPFQLLPPGPSNPAGDGSVAAVSRQNNVFAVWSRQTPPQLRSSIYYYSKRDCPTYPSETGSFRCPSCCPVLPGNRSIILDGKDRQFGPLPLHIAMFTNPAGDDFFPLGDGHWWLYVLFDTGSRTVGVSDVLPNRITGNNLGLSDAEHLRLTAVSPASVRVNGLSTIEPGEQPGWGLPSDDYPAEAVVAPISIGPISSAATLIGAPVANAVIARIDYTTTITDFQGLQGPDIKFFLPGEPGVPSSDVNIKLERFGNTTSTSGRTVGYRYYIRDLTFRHNGASATYDPADPDPLNFFYDTGTTITIVNDRLAGLLGLVAGAGSFDCLSGTGNGYTIDSVVMKGTSSAYTLNRAEICWSESSIISPQQHVAVIGSNFFDQLQIVFNGPADWLGLRLP